MAIGECDESFHSLAFINLKYNPVILLAHEINQTINHLQTQVSNHNVQSDNCLPSHHSQEVQAQKDDRSDNEKNENLNSTELNHLSNEDRNKAFFSPCFLDNFSLLA